MNWTSLKTRTTFSLGKSTIKLDKLIERLKKENHKAVAVTELGNLFSSVRMFQECQKAKIKPILGCDFFVPMGDSLGNITVLAKNLEGWKALIKSVSWANLPTNINNTHKLPTISLEKLAEFLKGNCITYVGSINSHFAKQLWTNWGEVIQSRNYEKTKAMVVTDWESKIKNAIYEYFNYFGKENVYLEKCVSNHNVECVQIINKLIDWTSVKFDVPKIGTSNVVYLDKEDAEDQRILLASAENTTLQNVEQRIENLQEYEDLLYFRSSTSYLPHLDELPKLFSHVEVENTQKVVDACGEYDILGKPKVPKFECPNDLSYDEYLRYLCREGWKKKIQNQIPKDRESVYADRIKYELKTIEDAGLAAYFIVVADIVNWAKNQGWFVGERGSVGGSLIAHLTNITDLDPIKYDLMYERFWNPGRKGSLPDIDMDFPIFKRESVVEYIRNKYGRDKVAQMATFSRFQGREAVKTVLRAKQRCGHDEMNRITLHIPDESKIADELQEMKEQGIEPTIIKWALENNKDKLKEWCYYDDNGELQGSYAKDFAQAMRLEGLKKQQGKHASGFVIANEPLENFCPLLYDNKTGEHIIGYDMQSAEASGCLKVDVLGSAVLDHLMDMIDIINTGDCQDVVG